jgi:hypothetical protein
LGIHRFTHQIAETGTMTSPPGENPPVNKLRRSFVMNVKNLSTLLLATAATLGIGIGSAFAQQGPNANGYVYPDFWGNATSQAAPKVTAAAPSNSESVATYVTHSGNQGTWLFPPDPNAGGNS